MNRGTWYVGRYAQPPRNYVPQSLTGPEEGSCECGQAPNRCQCEALTAAREAEKPFRCTRCSRMHHHCVCTIAEVCA